MSAEHPKVLVVDTSVARAAGRTEHPTSRNARQTLLAILEHGHAFGASGPLREEWKSHASTFAREWLTSMYARRRVRLLDGPPQEVLRHKPREVARRDEEHQAMDKDCHLVEAAPESDRLVLSFDEAARGLFHEAALKVGELRVIGWVNPDQQAPAPKPWLEEGAPHHRTRKLGEPPMRLPK